MAAMTLTRASNSYHHRLLPFAAAVVGVAAFSVMDAVMKDASMVVGVYSALVLRNLAGVALVLPLWLAGPRHLPKGKALTIDLQRSAVVACMAPLFFWGLVRVPMAEAIAISFIAPLAALYFAHVFLGEKIRRTAILAALLGLAGVIVIAAGRSGGAPQSNAALLGIAAILVSAMFYAVNLVLQRRQAQLAGPLEIVLFQNLFVGLFLSVAAPWLFTWPDGPVLIRIGIAGALACAALALLSWAYARAETQSLVASEYTGFLWAALLGWLWFDEALSPATVAGAALIVIGCWIATREPAPTP